MLKLYERMFVVHIHGAQIYKIRGIVVRASRCLRHRMYIATSTPQQTFDSGRSRTSLPGDIRATDI